jgi:hypothetical protein
LKGINPFLRAELLGLLDGFVDAADHVERLLGHVVAPGRRKSIPALTTSQ